MPTLRPSLWFDGDALTAAEFYVTVFPNSVVTNVARYGPDEPGAEGSVLSVDFVLDGTAFAAINGGPQFPFTEAVSFVVPCVDQAEVDHYWYALIADGGQESQCGWLKDRFGLSWQIVPDALHRLIGDPDEQRRNRAVQAMLGMRRRVVEDLEKAAAG